VTLHKPPTQQYQGVSAADRLAGRRHRLIEAGIDLFGTKGYRDTSIDELCARAGLTKRYFYESFTGREDLLLAVYDVVNGAVLEAALGHLVASGQPPTDVIDFARSLTTSLFEHLRAEPRHGRILFVEVLGVSPAVDKKYLENTSGIEKLLVGLVSDSSRLSVKPELLARAALGTVLGMAVAWMQNGQREDVSDMVNAIVALYGGELDGPSSD